MSIHKSNWHYNSEHVSGMLKVPGSRPSLARFYSPPLIPTSRNWVLGMKLAAKCSDERSLSPYVTMSQCRISRWTPYTYTRSGRRNLHYLFIFDQSKATPSISENLRGVGNPSFEEKSFFDPIELTVLIYFEKDILKCPTG